MKRFLAVSSVFLGLALGAPFAAAQQVKPVRFAYLTAVDLLPYFVAEKNGYFNEVGVKIEPMLVTGGAAVIGAVSSGSAEIGYAGAMPLIAARTQGLPLKYFSGMALDKGPKHHTLVYLSSSSSGIAKAADLKGKTIAMNARSGQCELIAKLRLADAGLSISDVKVTTIPFPQMQAAVQMGSVDAACNNDPFLTSMRKAGIDVEVMSGLVAKDLDEKTQLHSGLFASEAWLKANPETVVALRNALNKAIEYIAKDESGAREILREYTKIEPGVAELVTFSNAQTSIPPASLQAVVDAAVETKLIPSRVNAAELIDDLAKE